MKFSALLFDLDGTLIDTVPDFATAINRLRKETGDRQLSVDEIRGGVTHGSFGLVARAYGIDSDHPDFEPLRQRLLQHYRECQLEQSALFPLLDQSINWCEANNTPWGIVTNKPEAYTTPLVDHLGLKPAVVICPDHVTHAKPHPEPMLLACSKINVDPTEAIYVGDHPRDIQSGNGAGCTTVAVGWGYIDGEEDIRLWQADYACDTPADFINLLFK